MLSKEVMDLRLLPVILFVIGFLFLIFEMASTKTGFLSLAGVCFIMLAAFIDSFANGPFAVLIIFIIILILFFIMFQMLKRNTGLKENFILEEVGENFEQLNKTMIGRIGLAMEDLNPDGKVDFDGLIRKVTTNGKLIEKNHMVEVIEIKDNTLIVIEVKNKK